MAFSVSIIISFKPLCPAVLARNQKAKAVELHKQEVLKSEPKSLPIHRQVNHSFDICERNKSFLHRVPQINAFGKEISMMPVFFVLGVTAIKDLFEDRRRRESDKRVNNSTCRIWKG